VAIEAFSQFLQLSFGTGERLFDPEIWYVPGNHDHHVWEGAREYQYVQYLADAERPAPSWHSTRLRGVHGVRSPLLDAVVARVGSELSVQVSYPNLALSDDGPLVVLHHGHFVEALYTAMSGARAIVFPGQLAPEQVWDIEADNWSWLEFVWSGIGRSGTVGEDIGIAYDMLRDPAATRALALGAFERVPIPRRWRWVRIGPIGWCIRLVLSRPHTPERFSADGPLSAAAREGLRRYLTGPLARQIDREYGPGLAETFTFVFGHTHKPFVLDGFADQVRVVNTGGWVVDTAGQARFHGGSVVLIDEHHHVDPLEWLAYDEDGRPLPSPLQSALGPAVELRRRAIAARIAAGTVAVAPRRRRLRVEVGDWLRAQWRRIVA
jgi:hypothetical protein